MNLPLEGILVLDLSRVLAGPFCTMRLADLGARVIKVEPPGAGDVTRQWGPPFDAAGESAYYLSVNRNKESLELDLATAPGRTSLGILASRADVLVENFAPGALKRLGLSISSFRAANPRLVVGSITGFGRAGPDRELPGFDLLAQAGAGLMWITGEPDGPPQKVGVAVSDLAAGATLAEGILAALLRRDRTGEGARIDVDLFSSTLAFLPNVIQACLATGTEARRHGSGHAQIVPYQLFEAADGGFILAVGTDRQFRILCKRVVDRAAWASDPRYATNPSRVANREGLCRQLSEIFRLRPKADWVARCREAGVPAGPLRGPLAALGSEQARSLGLLVADGEFRTVASPIRLESLPAPIRRPPRLGEQTEALRAEFGLP
jgi:crotonobetainyl-CoA:carnitine CoA-transferase CaiB-like acyl-CoA transferase